MAMTTVLHIDDLWKGYRLGVIGHGTLYHDLQSWWARVRGREDPNVNLDAAFSGGHIVGERVWALRGVSFQVGQGEMVGIIGKNGAGKSTLLKIISRVTAPTRGRVKLKGRVASLLEVGTGFHYELTGRENIFLNGAILGMGIPEIRRKFDEIVAFSGVEAFIDTPVKRYSSGMFVRLAFAVAAHLDPDIFVVDEVLAVGDAGFQKKCLAKIASVVHEGRTVLFVSHNLPAISKLCPRGILLEKGGVITDGPMGETLHRYREVLHETSLDLEAAMHNPEFRRGSGAIRFTAIALQDEAGTESTVFAMGDTIRFKLSYQAFKELQGLAVLVALRSGVTGEVVTSARHLVTAEKLPAGATGTVVVEFPHHYIRPGEYPIYGQISEARPGSPPGDVVDGLTAPLIILPGDEPLDSNVDLTSSLGYFSLPSRAFLVQ
jgi:lipopolysaccharide transport system ATP-binding protein